MRLRLFAGFESVGHANVRGGVDLPQEPQPQQQPQYTQEQVQQLLFQQWQMQQMQQAYQQGYQQAMAQQQAQAAQPCEEAYDEMLPENQPEWTYDDDPDALPFDMANIAREEGLVDNSIYMRPAGQKKPEIPSEEPVFYPPEMDDEEEEEDWILEVSDELPKSEYVGQDEAEIMKREVWNKYFGGGAKQ